MPPGPPPDDLASPVSRFDSLAVVRAAKRAVRAAREGRFPASPRRWVELFKLHRLQEAHRRATARLPADDVNTSAAGRGIAIVAYLDADTGVGAAAASTQAAAREAGLRVELVEATRPGPPPPRADVIVMHVNADQVPVVAAQIGPAFFRGRHTIGVWAWELPEWPAVFDVAFRHVDEVWAMSRFIQDAVAGVSPVPVVHMPLSVTVDPTPGLGRPEFGLPDGCVFLMMYDAHSIQERKNPAGAIEAFRRAFPDPNGVSLVIKVSHAARHAAEVDDVRRLARETPGVRVLDRPMSRADAQALQAACDVFVALHRSEGFGLNIAEAMRLGKPAIVTGWSGNMDFTSESTACLVGHRLVSLDRDHGPYRAGSTWAEPDLDHAADWMRRLAADRSLAASIGGRAADHLARAHAPAVIGRRITRRLAAIRRFRPAPAEVARDRTGASS